MLKVINLKKVVFGILVFLIICFAYVYQKPILTTGEAIDYSVQCLNNPSKELGIKSFNLHLDDITSVNLSIDTKSGFFSKLTNQRELSVTLKTKTKNRSEATVRIDAYSGKCIEVTGPLS